MLSRGTVILAFFALAGVCLILFDAISSRDAEIAALRADLADAEATAVNLRSRGDTDAVVCSLPEPALREELSRWVH